MIDKPRPIPQHTTMVGYDIVETKTSCEETRPNTMIGKRQHNMEIQNLENKLVRCHDKKKRGIIDKGFEIVLICEDLFVRRV